MSWRDLFATHFAFLREYGFSVPNPTGEPREWMGAAAEYTSSTTVVGVEVDRGDVRVEIGINDPIVIHRKRVPLIWILLAKGVDPKLVYTAYDPAEGLDRWQLAEREIAEAARAMQTHCADILLGDFRIFPSAEVAGKEWYARLRADQAAHDGVDRH